MFEHPFMQQFGSHVVSRRGLLALPAAAALGLQFGTPGPALAGTDQLPAAVQAQLIPAMQEAIDDAQMASGRFGAVLLDVNTGQTLFRGGNTQRDNGDPSAHAEIVVLRAAGMSGIDLTRTVLVGTAECCPMCATLTVFTRLAASVYGSSTPDRIAFGWHSIPMRHTEIVARAGSQMPVIGGVLKDQTDLLYSRGPSA